MPDIDPRLPVGRIAITHPQSIRVFERHGIDFCCGGARPLTDLCAAKRIDVDALLAEIALASAPVDGPKTDWDDQPLSALVDHIEARYHRPLESDLHRLQGLVTKVVRVHGPTHGEQMDALDEAFTALREDIEPHMKKEEEVLFPWIRGGRGETATGAVKVLSEEHEDVGAILERIRAITDDYEAPEDACGTWRALWDGLHELERDLHAHIHLENNILFPRALA